MAILKQEKHVLKFKKEEDRGSTSQYINIVDEEDDELQFVDSEDEDEDDQLQGNMLDDDDVDVAINEDEDMREQTSFQATTI